MSELITACLKPDILKSMQRLFPIAQIYRLGRTSSNNGLGQK